jgi:hypothetical protein
LDVNIEMLPAMCVFASSFFVCVCERERERGAKGEKKNYYVQITDPAKQKREGHVKDT